MSNPKPVQLSAEARRRQRGRNWAFAGALFFFVAVVFIVTIVKLKATMG